MRAGLVKDCGWQDGREAGMLLGWQRLSLRAMHSPPPGPFPSPPSLGWADLAEGRFRRLGACVGGRGGRGLVLGGDERAGYCWGRGAGRCHQPQKPRAAGGLAGRRRGSGCRRAEAGPERCVRAEYNDRARGRRLAGQGHGLTLARPRGVRGAGVLRGPAAGGRRHGDGGEDAPGASSRAGSGSSRGRGCCRGARRAQQSGGRRRGQCRQRRGGGRGAAASPSRAGGDSRAAPRRRGPREGAVSEQTPNPPERGAEGEGAKMAAAGGRALSS